MLPNEQGNSFNEWSELSRLTTRAEVAIEQNRQDIETVSYMQKRKDEMNYRLERLTRTINRCTAIYKDIEANLEEKKKVALEDYEAAVRDSNSIVSDSDVSDMNLVVEGGRAIIANKNGHDLNEREGSAERSTVGLLMRYVTLVKQPTYAIPLMMFDETFFTLSSNSCEEMRDYLVEMSRHMLIIAVEQKDTLFNDIEDKTVYTFVKEDDKKTKIRLEGAASV